MPDTLQAYQELAGLWRLQLAAPVVAVTGSAGKTTTRELIRSALAPLGPIWASSGNENNDVGVPLTLLGAAPDQAAVVVEMGMRGLGEIERLSRCASPDVAVITNIGTAHIGRLGSREAIATAKCEIVAGLGPDGLVVIPAGDPLLDRALARVWSGRVVRVALQGEGHEAAADLLGSLDCQGAILELAGVALPMPLEGVHHARNLLLAMAVARELGLEPERWRPLQVDLPGGRSRRLQQNGVLILDETYNASPEAVLAALELLAQQPGRHFAVLGTMLELGEQSLALAQGLAAAAELGLDIQPLFAQHIERGEAIDLPPDLFGPCGTVEAIERPVFDPGFDRSASSKAGVFAGVDRDGPAYAAGIRDGMRRVAYVSSAEGNSQVSLVYRVADETGEREIGWLPEGKSMITVRQFTLGPNAETPACIGVLAGH